MTWARLVLDYFRVLDWPVVVLIIVFLFRSKIATLIERIKEASGFGISLKLENKARKLAVAGLSLPEPIAEPKETISTFQSQSTADQQKVRRVLVQEDAWDMQVFRGWVKVEKLMRKLSEQIGMHPGPVVNVRQVAAELRKKELISEETAIFIRDLQAMRNELVHESTATFLTRNAAESLLVAIDEILDVLNHLSTQLPSH